MNANEHPAAIAAAHAAAADTRPPIGTNMTYHCEGHTHGGTVQPYQRGVGGEMGGRTYPVRDDDPPYLTRSFGPNDPRVITPAEYGKTKGRSR